MRSLPDTPREDSVQATNRRLDIFPYLLVLPLFGIMLLVNLYPLVSALRLSLLDYNIQIGTQKYVGFENYRTIVADSVFWRVIRNTVAWTVLSVGIGVPLGLASALLLNQSFRGRGLARALVLVPWVMPPVVTAFIWSFLLSDTFSPISAFLKAQGWITQNISFLGDYQSGKGPFTLPLLSVAAVNIWGTVPFFVLVFLAGLQSVPEDLYEAARIDGAGAFRRFANITLPLLWPIVEVVVLLDVIAQFGRFNLNYLMTNGGPFNSTNILAVYLYQNAFQLFRFGLGAAIGVVMFLVMLPLALLYLAVAHRRMVEDG